MFSLLFLWDPPLCLQVDKYSIADWVYSLQVLPTRGVPTGDSREPSTKGTLNAFGCLLRHTASVLLMSFT